MNKNLINLCLAETHKHVRKVQEKLFLLIGELQNRSLNHDNSKFEEPELSIFAANTEKLAKTQYGTPEYKELLAQVKPAIDHHYSKNRHHPEFHRNGVEDMDLVDVVEMLSDWIAATERVKDGNIRKSIEINAVRYNLSPQLVRILTNTVDRYF
jgi:hypothetical protein